MGEGGLLSSPKKWSGLRPKLLCNKFKHSIFRIGQAIGIILHMQEEQIICRGSIFTLPSFFRRPNRNEVGGKEAPYVLIYVLKSLDTWVGASFPLIRRVKLYTF